MALLLFMVESRDDLYGVHKEPTSLLGSCNRQSLLKIYHAMQPLRPASKDELSRGRVVRLVGLVVFADACMC